jgi:alpha-tubulin suppressor-like RCC1 family protein
MMGALLAALLSACGSGNRTLSSSANPSVFYAHSVALQGNTTLAWGANTYGQLGNGDTKGTAQYVPVPVIGNAATGMTGVSAGGTHTLAFIINGSVLAWGNNSFGQLGNNSSTATSTPVQVFTGTDGTPLSAITAVSAGFNHSLARRNDATVWAWGSNSEGQLGFDPTATPSEPIAVQVLVNGAGSAGLTNITAVSAGGAHSLAIYNDGINPPTALAWGSDTEGQLGINNAQTTYYIPTTVYIAPTAPANALNGTTPLTGITAIAAGGSHSLFLQNGGSSGTVWACGNNVYGQLGIGNTTNQTGVQQVLNLTGVIAIAAGLDHSLALKSDGTVWAWGYNYYGQLGNGGAITFTPFTIPAQVLKSDGTALTGITTIVAIGNHNLAVNSNGQLFAWGDNGYGELGLAVNDGNNRAYATAVPSLSSSVILYSP